MSSINNSQPLSPLRELTEDEILSIEEEIYTQKNKKIKSNSQVVRNPNVVLNTYTDPDIDEIDEEDDEAEEIDSFDDENLVDEVSLNKGASPP